MSCYEWESGDVLLPAKEVVRLRAALNTAAAERRTRVQAEVERLWPHLRPKTAAVRLKMVRQPRTSFQQELLETNARWGYREYRPYVYEALRLFEVAKGKKPTDTVYTRCGYAKPTNRTTSWSEGELSITLQGRTVHYHSGDNNHAAEHARKTLLGTAFFQYLTSVTWTRGTGGELAGNDEYNREADYAGGGGNYVTARYGPVGQAAEEAERARLAAALRAAG